MLSINEDFILYLYQEHKDSRRVADELLKIWYRDDVEINKLKVISNYLINNNLLNSYLNAVAYRIQNNESIFWEHFLESLARVHLEKLELKLIPAKKEFFDPIFAGAAEQNSLEQLVLCKKLDSFDLRFEKIRNSILQEYEQKKTKTKQRLLDSIELFKNERLMIEEEKAIKELIHEFPDETFAIKLHDEFYERKARSIFKPNKKAQLELLKLEKKWLNSEKQLESEQNEILIAMQKQAELAPEDAYNMAIALRNMEQNELALEVLKFSNAKEKDWLAIELLLESERFIEVLDLIQKIEQKEALNIESLLACLYTKARAFYGLGKHEEAVALLTSIVEKKPNYRSAHSLLQQWQRISE